MKLSRILSNRDGISRKHANALIATGRVAVDGRPCREAAREVDRFSAVTLDNTTLQAADTPRYLMLHKPAGYLSATVDAVHPTVLDLIAPGLHEDLHIAGRLDRASTGLLILTNNGAWSRQLTEPEVKIPKVYRVSTAKPISDDTAKHFARGIWFEFEQLRTSPAELERLGEREARVTIYEGRYHQVKRMFHACNNQVTKLHRERMGSIRLDEELAPGAYRPLTRLEINHLENPGQFVAT